MRKISLISVIIVLLFSQSCEIIEKINPLTETEVIEGLKEALNIGTDSAAVNLSKIDGYFRDEVIKILLPPEADIIVKNVEIIPGGKNLIDNLILSINRSAEEAAKEVTPIFLDAIKDLTIQDGFEILRDNNNSVLAYREKNTYPAATRYLETNTYSQLQTLYQPKINNVLNMELVAGVSTNKTWQSLKSLWNSTAPLFGYDTVNTELDLFLTQSALDGLFYKIAIEEEKIRTDPLARVTDLLKRVFGNE